MLAEFKHGRSGYQKRHCRCDICKGAQASYKKLYRVDNLEKCKEYDRKARMADLDGFRARARERYRENPRELERKREYKSANLEKWQKYSKEYHEAHRGEEHSYSKEYRSVNSEKVKASQQKWRETHRELHRQRSNEYQKKRRREDPIFRLRMNLSRRISRALGRGNKDRHTAELIECSISELRQHLESKFKQGMSWSNYGEWHIDHIRPCSSFDLADAEQQKICFNWRNLQPLWAKENLIKSDKVA